MLLLPIISASWSVIMLHCLAPCPGILHGSQLYLHIRIIQGALKSTEAGVSHHKVWFNLSGYGLGTGTVKPSGWLTGSQGWACWHWAVVLKCRPTTVASGSLKSWWGMWILRLHPDPQEQESGVKPLNLWSNCTPGDSDAPWVWEPLFKDIEVA